MNNVNIGLFDFDYDTTWAAFFLDADLNIYSRYGGRDAEASDSRLTKNSLLQTMHEVLDVHEDRKAAGFPADDSQTHPRLQPDRKPEEMPLLKNNHSGCLHCHQIQEFGYLQKFHDGKFTSDDLFGFPLPENLGIQFDRQHGHRIEKIVADTPADGKLQPGDLITRINRVPVHSEQDVRWALHHTSAAEAVEVTLQRPAKRQPNAEKDAADSPTVTQKVTLKPVRKNWKHTELGWRKSLRSVPLPLGFLGYALGREELKRGALPADRLAIRITSIRGQGLSTAVGLHKGDVIIAVGDRTKAGSFEEFLSELLHRYQPGAEVRLRVLRDGKEMGLRGRFPDWHTDDTSVP